MKWLLGDERAAVTGEKDPFVIPARDSLEEHLKPNSPPFQAGDH